MTRHFAPLSCDRLKDMDPFLEQLKGLCASYPTRAKWVFVPTHAIGRTLGDRLVVEGTDWANLRFVTPLDIALRMGAPFLVEHGIDPSEEELGPALMMRLLLDLPLEGGYFRPLADHPTLAQALWATVRELRMAGVSAQQIVANAFESSAKHAEIVALLSAYERFLNDQGRADMATVHQEALKHRDWCPIQPKDCWTELPDANWNPLQRALLDGLPGERLEPKTFELPGVSIPRRLMSSGIQRLQAEPKTNPLAFLMTPAFVATSGAPKPEVHLFHAGGREAEIEDVFRRILAANAGPSATLARYRLSRCCCARLADPQDPLSLIAVLRGPLFGISDPELFDFKQRGGWFSVFQDPDKPGQPDGSVSVALAALNRYYRWTRVLPAAGALERVLEDSGYLALAATTPGGVDAGDVVHAVDRVRQVVETGGSLADAADALEADREATSEVESLPLEPGRTDVVRLMNLHKAKGLEANVVFLADPLGGVKARVDVHIERAELEARGWLKLVRRSEASYAETLLGEHADWGAHEAAELPYLQPEEDRLLYVAATRARQLLVVSRWTGNANNGAWRVLDRFLGEARELSVPAAVTAPAVVPQDCSMATQSAAAEAREKVHARVNQPSWSVTSVTEKARHIARMTRSVDASADDPSKVVVGDTPSHRADAGQAWGTLVHGLLEHAMRHRNATREDLRRLAMWLTVEEPQCEP